MTAESEDNRSIAARVLAALAEGNAGVAGQLLNELLAPDVLHSTIRSLIEANALLMRGEYESGLRSALPLIAELESFGLERQLAWIYSGIGFALGVCGDPERGLEWTTRGLVASDGDGGLSRIKVLSNHGCLLGMLEQIEPALEALEAAEKIGAAGGHFRSQALSLSNLSYACLNECWQCEERGDLPTALHYASRARDYSERMSAVTTVPDMAFPLLKNQINLGLALISLRQAKDALAVLESVRDTTKAWPPVEVDCLLGSAKAYRLLGQFDRAHADVSACRKLAETQSLELSLPRIFLEQVELAKASGDTAAALRHSETHAAFLRKHYMQRLRAVARSAALFADAERARMEARTWRDAAMRDALTGTWNRRGLDAQLSIAMATKKTLAVAIFDADHFKQVNDSFGHATGDAVLAALPKIIARESRLSDVLARIGGEEFVLVLPGTGIDIALMICERIREAVERHDWHRITDGLALTVSIGLTAHSPQETIDDTIIRADEMLYAAKSGGRNRVCTAA